VKIHDKDPQPAHTPGLLPGRGGIPRLVRKRRRAVDRRRPTDPRRATWIEAATRELAAPSVNGQVVPINPAHSVRGPRHVVTTGQTPVLDPAEARATRQHRDEVERIVI